MRECPKFKILYGSNNEQNLKIDNYINFIKHLVKVFNEQEQIEY